MAGIEQNPGPSTIWICSVCKHVLRNNTTSVRCNNCNEWCHLKACSGLQHHRFWNQDFVASCCTVTTASNTASQNSASNQSQASTTASQNSISHQSQASTTAGHNSVSHQFQAVSPSRQSEPSSLKILQFNCVGLRSKVYDIINFMEKHNVLVGVIQETKLNENVNVHVPGYSIVRNDRDRDGGGGLAFIISNRVKYRTHALPAPPNNDTTLEQQAIAIVSGTTEITLINVYIPPSTCSPTGYTADIEHLLTGHDDIILGDFNAHHPTWHSALKEDARGTVLSDQIDQSEFGTLNENYPTRIRGDIVSSPDITMASASLLPSIDWCTKPALSSDHIPIIITLQRTIAKCKSDRTNYTNFAKADWPGFREHTELKFSRIPQPDNVNTGEQSFRAILKKAARIFIPAGCYKEIRPNFPTSAAKMADERDVLRESDPNNPRIQQLSKEIRNKVNEHLRDKWRQHLKKSSFKPNTGGLWQTIKRLSNPQKTAKNAIISHRGVPVEDDTKCANEFNRLFTTHPAKQDKSIRSTLRKIHLLESENSLSFDEQQVEETIKASKPSKALGPDGVSPIMLKHLGPLGIAFITALLNLSLSSLLIPGIWKVGKVIPLLKPSKPVDQAKSYRPISLLSPIAKILEALLLPILAQHLQPASHQHGFRKRHSTTTALHLITDHIQNGLNQRRPNQRTVLVALDLSRAFDTVNHSILFKGILDSSLPTTVKRWIANYMRGRQTFVEFRDKTSKHRKLKQGVPQGGVLSPLLFNFYMSSLPAPPDNIRVVSYADDITVLCTNTNIALASECINEYLAVLHQWLIDKRLELSPEKSTATLFTTWNLEMNNELDVYVANHRIPTVNKPKILGVVFDNLMNFSTHINQVCNRLQSRNNVMKSLAGSTWGKDKETLITTYKAIGRSVINYAAPIWTPQVSDTSWKKLQTSQNAALRVATGCHLMSNQDHLHEETKVLPVRQHNVMLSEQYLLSCHLPNHPCHATVTNSPPPRNIRRGLMNGLSSEISKYIPPSGLNHATYKEGLKAIHTDTVANAFNGYTNNRVLGRKPPPIDDTESILPRKTRTTLAQLRSGWCRLLNTYLARIDSSVVDVCPLCGSTPHDTRHLFRCPSNPTSLEILSLWTKPIEAAAFLNLETEIAEDDNRR